MKFPREVPSTLTHNFPMIRSLSLFALLVSLTYLTCPDLLTYVTLTVLAVLSLLIHLSDFVLLGLLFFAAIIIAR